jgi:hypothetical protein
MSKKTPTAIKPNPMEVHDGWIENLKNEKWGMIQ